MANRFYQLSDLTPMKALRLLLDFVEQAGEYAPLLNDAVIRLDDSPFGTLVMIRLPRYRLQRRWRSQAIDALGELYATASGGAMQLASGSDKADQPLQQGIAALLEASGPATPPDEHGYNAQEKLLIASGLSMADGRELYDKVRVYATAARLALAKQDKQDVFLYHVLDDETRLSLFQGAVAGQEFAGTTLLQRYDVPLDQTYALFLPDTMQPDRQALNIFCRLLLTVPALFGVRGLTEIPQSILTAITPDDADAPRQLLPLATLRFYDEWELGDVKRVSQYRVANLQGSEQALKQLRQHIDQHDAQSGYRLQLRASDYLQASDLEYKRLQRQVSAMRDRMAELTSLSQASPRLLRFTREQLPALAAVISSYRPDDLAQLRYSFEANRERHPQGVHYLYIDPDSTPYSLDPLVWHDVDDAQPIEFWLDPHWARYYHRSPNRVLVFVPKSRRLFPPMHTWDVATMDTYLRQILHSQSLPANPLYLFDALNQATETNEIDLTILDMDAFLPLSSPNVIGWLNDNLLTLTRFPDTEAFIQLVADDDRRMQVVRAIDADADAMEATFKQQALEVGDAMASVTDELMQVLDDEFTRLMQQAENFTRRAQVLNRKLNKLESLYQELQSQSEQADNAIAETRQALTQLDKDMRILADRVRKAISSATSERNRLIEEINATVDDILTTRQGLEARLNELDT